MKIFLDTADVEQIREANSWGIIDGVTTNPTLMVQVKRPYEDIVKEIVSIVDGPISAEAICAKCDDIVKEARALSKIHKNIVVKIPMGVEGLKAVKKLSDRGREDQCHADILPEPGSPSREGGGDLCLAVHREAR